MKYTPTKLPLFESSNYATALGSIQFAAKENVMLVLLGQPGSGKTTLLKAYLKENPYAHYILCSPNMGMKDLLREMAEQVGVHIHGNTYEMQKQLTDELKEYAEHCFLLDECEYLNRHNITKLEIIRQIWDETHVTFVLCGTYKLDETLKGCYGKNNHSQIYRRLFKEKLDPIKQAEVYTYLDTLEKNYAVRFTQEARVDLYAQCIDLENGGIGTFFSLIELAFSAVRPEWKAISLQLKQGSLSQVSERTDENCDTEPHTSRGQSSSIEHPFFIDISTLKLVEIKRSTLRAASMYKVTK